MSDDRRRDRDSVTAAFDPGGRVSLIQWHTFSGPRTTVVLTLLTTGLTFVSGLSHLSYPVAELGGPLATAIPFASVFVRFSGVALAFVLGPVVVGLQYRKRLAWRAALFLFPTVSVIPLTTFAATDLPLLAVVAVTLASLLRDRDHFRRPVDLTVLQTASLAGLGGALVYGSVGAYGLRDQFVYNNQDVYGGVWTDALYYVFSALVISRPFEVTASTRLARWFTLSVVAFSTSSFAAFLGSLILPAFESRVRSLSETMPTPTEKGLNDHVVILGYSQLTEPLLRTLDDGTDRLIVTEDEKAATTLESEGEAVVVGDPADEAVLQRARVSAAGSVAVSNDTDANSVLTVVAVRRVVSDVRVVAVATSERHVEKFEDVGADEVVNLRQLGGRVLAESLLKGRTQSE
jgi:voltage-gated potassium channel